MVLPLTNKNKIPLSSLLLEQVKILHITVYADLLYYKVNNLKTIVWQSLLFLF